MIAAIIHGFVLRFGLILPLGVQNFYIFSQGAVRKKYIHVVPVSLTASICDTFLILAAVLGVSALVATLEWFKLVLIVGGGIFLIYMGIQSWRASTRQSSKVQANHTIGKTIAFTVMISILNPHAILDTVGVIGTSSIQYTGWEKAAFTVSTVTVSWIWFFGLGLAGRLLGLRDKSGKLMVIMNRISAIVMWLAAVYLLKSLFA
ncbi:MAG TPA: LysE family transporter [Paenibacillus sp.]|uniref:LysE/ArgO family amino acid transporter n=1 Tax=Paenibacillus sp. TaxID=58172 RepID=UPI002C93DDD6|nr:LysE family transporter [Paenibacillus sp.]HUC91207.1 LysE family transporter [Paenibacillus sp.]